MFLRIVEVRSTEQSGIKGVKIPFEITLTIQYNNRLHGNCALFAQFHYLRKNDVTAF